MRIHSLKAFPVRLPRNISAARGTAGSPTVLEGCGDYRWSSAYPVLYSIHFETALIRMELSNGLVGWGEAQAPVAPEVACAIVEGILRLALEGVEFDGMPEQIEMLWERMYSTMRVRGQTGGFMLDAMSGVDLALWDLAGKIARKPVCELLHQAPSRRVPAYLSGLSGATLVERISFATRYADAGIGCAKIYYESEWADILRIADQLPGGMRFAVDALWHLPSDAAEAMARELDARDARWLECPFYPEDTDAHIRLAAAVSTPLAVGESYRTLRELAPLLESVKIVQPDLGRSGITGSMRIARAFAGEVVPHLSIAMGPQIAAALHFAAATPNCNLCEFNPSVLEMANRFLLEPIHCREGFYEIPAGPGLGIMWNDSLSGIVGDWVSSE